jgi:prevent-host-death family protein
MDTDVSMTLARVKDSFSKVNSQVEREHVRVHITKHGAPSTVLLAEDDLASLQETLEVLSNNELLADIRNAQQEGLEGSSYLTKEEALDLVGKEQDE